MSRLAYAGEIAGDLLREVGDDQIRARSFEGHHDINEIHDHLLRKGIVVNPSTIFRTLKLLVQAGIAVERQFANGNTKFELNQAHHDHLICLSCKKIIEFESPKLENVQAQIVRNHGFEMAYHRHEIYGYCSTCRRTGRRHE